MRCWSARVPVACVWARDPWGHKWLGGRGVALVPVGLQHAAHGSPWSGRALISAVLTTMGGVLCQPPPRAHIAHRLPHRPGSPLQGGHLLKKEGNTFFNKTAQALGERGKASSEPLPVLPSDSPATTLPPCRHWGLRDGPVLVSGWCHTEPWGVRQGEATGPPGPSP